MNIQRSNSLAQMEKSVSEKQPFVILCVDDDPVGLATRCMVLAAAGYDVLTAVSGAGAFRLLQRKRVDLVITDHFLPGMSGAELTVASKGRNPKLPVIVLTGAVETPPGCEQADRVVTKGASPEEFLAMVAQLLTKK
jgi:CheY-like chemotaxis protein